MNVAAVLSVGSWKMSIIKSSGVSEGGSEAFMSAQLSSLLVMQPICHVVFVRFFFLLFLRNTERRNVVVNTAVLSRHAPRPFVQEFPHSCLPR